jgi:hypothetical protein
VSMALVLLAIPLFGSACFLVGAWWATRPKDDPNPGEDEQELRSFAASCSSALPELTGVNSVKIVEKGQSETVPAEPSEPPTLEELLDQFERVFSPQLAEDLQRIDHPARTRRTIARS